MGTANLSFAGTASRVYLHIAGREFRLDTSANDFTPGSDRVYVLGQNSNVLNGSQNDPRTPMVLNTVDIEKFPTYVRLEGDDGWDIEHVIVTVNPGLTSQVTRSALVGAQHLLLDDTSGKVLYLK